MMQLLTNLLLATLISFSSISSAQVEFQSINFEQAKELAKAQKKDIFIDFRADWCKPCIAMEKYTFTDPHVAEVVNTNFIPMKADVDYFEAMDLQEMYNVSVLPTILIINYRGEVQQRLIGEKTPEKLMSELGMDYDKEYRDDEVVTNPSGSEANEKKECFIKRWFSKN